MHAARSSMVFLVTLTLTGCGSSDSGSTTEPPPPTTGAIAGTVRDGGTGVPGATLSLSGGATRTTTTAANGSYGFTQLTPGAYTVALTLPAGFRLTTGEPGSRALTVVAGQTATASFAVESTTAGNLVTINIAGFTFSPATTTIARGTTVRWVNGTNTFHTVTPDGHTAWSDANLAGGATFQHTFDTAGTFNYYCTPHRAAGMTGTINVQ